LAAKLYLCGSRGKSPTPRSRVGRGGSTDLAFPEARQDNERGGGAPYGPDVYDALRCYWNADAATYDEWPEHGAWSAGERAAWAGTLARLLPPPGARVLDVGAGTGFLSLAAARLGYEVTALDISAGMLANLRRAAADEGLSIQIVCGPAHEPPVGPFDAVIERLTLWALPDPQRALRAWRQVNTGTLIAFEAGYGTRDYVEGLRRRAREFVRRARRLPPEHHTASPELQAALSRPTDASPNAFIGHVEAAGWRSVHLFRLWDVEWARRLALPPLDRLAGVTPEYAISASCDAGAP
jgi:SAM-dependent methyltransferase